MKKPMILKNSAFLAVLLITTFVMSTEAHARRFALLGYGQKTEATDGGFELSPRDYGYGAALTAEIVSGQRHSLEIDVFYGHRRFGTDVTLLGRKFDFDFDATYIQVPLVYRLWIGALSLGFGAYYGKYLTVKTTVTDVRAKRSATSSAADVGGAFYGVTAVAGLRMPPHTRFGLDIQARYNYGLKSSHKEREYQALLGLNIQGGKSK